MAKTANHRSKAKSKSTSKSIWVTRDNFLVHPLARKPYQIYCEHSPIIKTNQNSRIISKKATFFEVIKSRDILGNEIFYFFDDFEAVTLLEDKQNIIVRQSDLTNIDIERRAWDCLLNELYSQKPVNTILWKVIKKQIPNAIADEIFSGAMPNWKLSEKLGISTSNYDYRASTQCNRQPHAIPSFAELISEVKNGN